MPYLANMTKSKIVSSLRLVRYALSGAIVGSVLSSLINDFFFHDGMHHAVTPDIAGAGAGFLVTALIVKAAHFI
jgi:hypothetical protein